ncbi:MAG: hypothetical protein ACLGSA_00850 [Acidobacteriota bacterium]
MSSEKKDFLVNVPALNPRTFPNAPEAVRFLNPGLAAPAEQGAQPNAWFRPENLPMAEPVVQSMMAQFVQMARDAKRAGDLSGFASAHRKDFHSSTSFAIRDDIRAAQSGEAAALEHAKILSTAQTELCLAWALEEVALELAGLEDKLDSQWAVFEQSLGLEDDDAIGGEGASLAGARPDLVPGGPGVPSAVLMDAVLTFLPPQCGLYCADQRFLGDWEEYGAVFVPATPETLDRFGLEGEFRQASLPGHLLCFSRRPDPAKPWLDGPRLVVAPVRFDS